MDLSLLGNVSVFEGNSDFHFCEYLANALAWSVTSESSVMAVAFEVFLICILTNGRLAQELERRNRHFVSRLSENRKPPSFSSRKSENAGFASPSRPWTSQSRP